MQYDQLSTRVVRQALSDNVKRAVEALFPIEDGGVSLRATNVTCVDSGEPGRNAWQDARVNGKTLAAPITADLELWRDGKKVQRLNGFRLGQLPMPGPLGSFMVGGNDWFSPHQLRLKPGAYTRTKTNGEIECFIPSKGMVLKLEMEPATGAMKFGIRGSTVNWYTLCRAAGATDKEMQDILGEALFRKNHVAAYTRELAKVHALLLDRKVNRDLVRAGLVEKVISGDGRTPVEQEKDIQAWLAGRPMDPYVLGKTLGLSDDHVTKAVLLGAAKRMLGVYRDGDAPDDRDALEFKTVHHVDDFIPERIAKMGRLLKWKVLNKFKKPGTTIAKALGANWLNPATVQFFGGSENVEGGLANTAEAANPLAILGQQARTTILGEGGIGDTRAVSNDARLFRPSSVRFIDAVKSPEGANIGLTNDLAWGTRKKGNTLVASFFKVEDGKLGALADLTVEEANAAVIGYPEFWDHETKKPTGKTVRANVHGAIEDVPATDVQYVIPSGRSMFGTTTNMASFIDHTHPNRALMAGKHLSQALPMVHREAPLATQLGGSGRPVAAEVAESFNVRASEDGEVKEVTPLKIVVGDKTYELFDSYGMQAKVALTHIPLVKVGDHVKAGQLLADSNYSRNGALTLGVNLRSAYMPAKNALNYEDAILISESAAAKLASYHSHRPYLELDDTTVVDKKIAQSQFPAAFLKREWYDALGDDGLIKVGTRVEPGQPLIAAVRKLKFDEKDRTSKNLASIHKLLLRPYKNATVVWDEDFPGTVYRVTRRALGIEVEVHTEEAMQVGDKLSMGSAAKGTVSAILPDDKMPHTKDGRHVEVLLSPHGIVNRVNPSQVIESAAGKLVTDGKTPYSYASFDGKDHAREIRDGLKQAGLSHAEELFDPETGRWLERPVAVGVNHFFKLDHSVRKKFSARERDSYTADERPTKGKGVGGQSYDHLTTFALLGHDAHALLGETVFRSQKNDEFWHAYLAGEPLPAPKVPFVFNKFEAFLHGAGVDTVQDGHVLKYLPMTEKRVLARSAAEVKDARMLRAKDLGEEPGGLFGPELGGMKGSAWGHIALGERMPHPLYEKTIRDITGITTSDFYGMVGHSKWYDPATGKFHDEAGQGRITGEAGFAKLLDFDVDKRMKEYKDKLKTVDGSDANKLNRAVRYLRGLKTSGLTPTDAYLTNAIPVVPPIFRPVTEMHGGDLKVSDANLLYKDLILAKRALEGAKADGLPEAQLKDARMLQYQAFGALVGVNNPLTHRTDRDEAKGFIDLIRGKRNKEGLFQSMLVSHRNDYTGRSTIEPDASLGPDEIGLPEDMIWKIYSPHTIRQLSMNGWTPAEAMDQVTKRTQAARQVLNAKMSEIPVIYNRSPSLHRWSVIAARPKMSPGQEIRISPLVESPLGSDHDGDTISVHVPITPAAQREALNLLPTQNLVYDKDRSTVFTVSKDAISGLHALTVPGEDSGKTYASPEEAMYAYDNNKDKLKMGSIVHVAGRAVPVGWLFFEHWVPANCREGITAPLDARKVDKVFAQLAKNAPERYNDVARALSLGGFHFASQAGGITATVDELVMDRSETNKLLHEFDAKVKAGKTYAERQAIANENFKEYDKKITDEVLEHIKKHDGGMAGFLASGSNTKKDQMKQSLASPLMVQDVHSRTVPSVILSGYAQGIRPSDLILTTPGARKGLVDRSQSTALPGALAKSVAAAAGPVRITERDCGTHRGLDEPASSPDVDLLDRHLCADYGAHRRNDVVTPAVLSDIRAAGTARILVRSPLTCESASPPCQMCAGRRPDGKLNPLGSNIGLNYGQSVSERSTQLVLRAFHTGGTLGSADNLTAGFTKLTNLLRAPEMIPNQGTISTVGGRVNRISPAPQGGQIVHIEGIEHYVRPDRELLVTNGQLVNRGDALSDGDFRPQDIAEHRGGLEAQRYVVEEARKAYEVAGAVVRRPVLEVLVAATMRHVLIKDDGGEPDIAIGDVIPEAEYEALRRKNPRVRGEATVIGLDAKPALSMDLMERLNHQRLDDAVRDVSASAGSSDLSGAKSPIPWLAHGGFQRPLVAR